MEEEKVENIWKRKIHFVEEKKKEENIFFLTQEKNNREGKGEFFLEK